jgi:FkbM family methyltransferase
MTFVDVGANVGYITALAAKLVSPRGRVIAFEPSPYAFERLVRMVESNGLTNVTPIRAGLSDTAGKLQLYLSDESHNHSPTMVPVENSTSVEVPVRVLDEVMEDLGIERIDFMKIDVEGHEPRVLRGAQQLLCNRRVSAVLCEFNEHWLVRAGSSPARLEALLQAGGLEAKHRASTGAQFENRFYSLPHREGDVAD